MGTGKFGHIQHGFGARFRPQSIVPAGLILPTLNFDGATMPAGWSEYSPSPGRAIMGAGGAHSAGVKGGANDQDITVTLASAGAHGAADVEFQLGTPAAGSAFYFDDAVSGAHSHTAIVSVNTVPPWKGYTLIQLDNTAALVPENVFIMSVTDLSATLSAVETGLDKLLRHSTPGITGGSNTSSGTATSSTNGLHSHGSMEFASTTDRVLGLQQFNSHTHSITISGTLNLKRRWVSLWASLSGGFELPIGAMGLWPTLAPPLGWALCDGTNGTPDMRDFVIQVGDSGNHGNSAGDNSVTYTGSTPSEGGHQHPDAGLGDQNKISTSVYHIDTVDGAHVHSVSKVEPDVIPRYIALAVIQFQGFG